MVRTQAMKIMITGATGLLGGNTARVLALEAGASVRALVRKTSSRAALTGIGAEALAAGVRRLVYVSTVDTLGLSSKEAPADETAEHTSMAAFRNPYVDTKYEAEQRALEIGARGLDLVIVKPTYMIGEWDVKPSSGQMVVEVAKGRALGCPGGGNNFVDVLDVARGVRLKLEKGRARRTFWPTPTAT